MDDKYVGGLIESGFNKEDKFFEDSFLVASPNMRLPKKFDLLDKTPIPRAQNGLSTCVNFCVAEAKSMLDNNKADELSPLFNYYFSRMFDGTSVDQDRGTTIRAACEALKCYGIVLENIFPYNVGYKQKPSREIIESAKERKINEYYRLRDGLYSILQYMFKYEQPVILGIEMFKSSMSHDVEETGYIPIPKKYEESITKHAMLAVGWRELSFKESLVNRFSPSKSNKGYIIALNSWGENFGDKGVLYIPFEFLDLKFLFDAWVIR